MVNHGLIRLEVVFVLVVRVINVQVNITYVVDINALIRINCRVLGFLDRE